MARARDIDVPRRKAAVPGTPAVSENIRGQPLVDFHLFAKFAPELQDAIWECKSSPIWKNPLIFEITH
jgi:hypothetical protein